MYQGGAILCRLLKQLNLCVFRAECVSENQFSECVKSFNLQQPEQTSLYIMDINDIEKNYTRMSDRELIHIATTRGEGLKPGVIEIIEKEITKRNLNPDLLAGVIAQNKTYTSEEIEQYAQLLSNLPCPVCDSSQQKLNGTVAYTVKSFLIFTTSERKPTIAFPDCLDQANDKAAWSTALLGWWGFP